MLCDLLGPSCPMKAILVDERPDTKCASRRFATARTVTSQRHPRFRVERITNRPAQTAPRKLALLVHDWSIVAACSGQRQRVMSHASSAVDALAEQGSLVGGPGVS